MCQLNSVRVGGPGKESIRVEAKERYTNCTLQPNLAFFFFFCPACRGSSHDGVASQCGSESNRSYLLAPFR
jgi:hypothetical protein